MKSWIRLVLLGAVCLLPACGAMQDALKQPDPTVGQVGEMVYLRTPRTFAIVVRTWGDFDPAIAGMNPNDLYPMQNNGVLYLPENGTLAKVLEIKSLKGKDNVRKVEILDGKFKGKTGYVSYEWVERPPAPTPK